jgi:hypothetical protein
MALSIAQALGLMKILKPGMKVASFGYPDIIVPIGLIKDLIGENYKHLVYRKDSDKICERHKLSLRPIPDAKSVFQCRDCELDVYDIVEERGCEILCDLNYPFIPRETYDVVLDVGTIEHCFNISQAAYNMAGMVKIGGYILHENPFNWGSHGFYNLTPTWYSDFYESNGFKRIYLMLASPDGKFQKVPFTGRFIYDGLIKEVNCFAMFQRAEKKDFVFPVQTKYKEMEKRRAAAGVTGEKDAA